MTFTPKGRRAMTGAWMCIMAFFCVSPALLVNRMWIWELELFIVCIAGFVYALFVVGREAQTAPTPWPKPRFVAREYIVGPAIQRIGKKDFVSLPAPYHHGDVVQRYNLQAQTAAIVLGFVTNRERFVDRIEGHHLALLSGQIPPGSTSTHRVQLYCEDLWDITPANRQKWRERESNNLH